MKNYDAYLFDFDYTLADSSRGIVGCFRDVLDRAGFPDISDETIKRTIGLTLEEAFSEMTGERDPTILSRWRKEYVKAADRIMNSSTKLFDEVPELFSILREKGEEDRNNIHKISLPYRRFLDESFRGITGRPHYRGRGCKRGEAISGRYQRGNAQT